MSQSTSSIRAIPYVQCEDVNVQCEDTQDIIIRGVSEAFGAPDPHPNPQYFMRMSCGYRN